MFGLAYETVLGNDVDGNDYARKIHLIYGATASPTDKAYGTINESPEAITFSWELTTTPVEIPGLRPSASLVIETDKTDADKLAAFEAILYGTASVESKLLLPSEIISYFPVEAPSAPAEG